MGKGGHVGFLHAAKVVDLRLCRREKEALTASKPAFRAGATFSLGYTLGLHVDVTGDKRKWRFEFDL